MSSPDYGYRAVLNEQADELFRSLQGAFHPTYSEGQYEADVQDLSDHEGRIFTKAMHGIAASREYWLGNHENVAAIMHPPVVTVLPGIVRQRENFGLILHRASGMNGLRQSFMGDTLNAYERKDPQDPPIIYRGLRLTRASTIQGMYDIQILSRGEGGKLIEARLEKLAQIADFIMRMPETPTPDPSQQATEQLKPLATVHYLRPATPEDPESGPA